MRKLMLIAALLTSSIFSFASDRITAVNNGSWRTNGTWNLNRNPQHKDTVIIPVNRTVTVDNNINLSSSDLVIVVYGQLRFAGAGDKLTLGAGSVIRVFTGGQIAGTGSSSQTIIIGTNTVFIGNGPVVGGPTMANATTSGFAPYNDIALPVKFISFSLAAENRDVVLNWATSEEVNASHYEIERSVNGTSFTAVGRVEAAGNSVTVNKYSFRDRNVTSNITYYRIRQVDADGRVAYTAVKTIRSDAKAETGVYAFDGKLVVTASRSINEPVTLRIVNLNGQVISESRVNLSNGQAILPVAARGNMVISISNGRDINFARQVVL